MLEQSQEERLKELGLVLKLAQGLLELCMSLDEPSIGLHERDTTKLIRTLRSLQQKGNSVIVVDTIEKQSYLPIL